MSTVEIVIKTLDQSKGDINKLTNNLGNLAMKYVSVGAVAGTVYKVMKESVKTTLDYANSVRQLSSISGESTETTSRFLQVLDDYKLSASDALLATKALTKQGLTPSIDTLAKLSDEYLSVNDAQARNEFILKNLGRGGLQWVEVLNKGSAALRAQGDAVNQNLILSQKQVDAARKNEIAVDNWNDALQGLKLNIGNGLLPVMTDFVNSVNEGARAAEIMREQGLNPANKASEEYRNALKQAHDEQVSATEAMLKNADAADTLAEKLGMTEEELAAISKANEDFIGTLGDVKGMLTDYNQGVAEADAALAAGEMTIDEHAAKIKELGAAYQDAKNQVVLSIVEMKLAQDGWTNAELDAYLKIGKQLGVFDEKMVTTTKSVLAEADYLTRGMGTFADTTLHAGARAEDAAVSFGGLARAAAELGELVRKEANGPVGQLKRDLAGMPPSGTSWAYAFDIQVSGRVPNLNVLNAINSGQRAQAPIAPHPGQQSYNQNMWTGGTLPGSGIALVGDMPGGNLGPYTEAVIDGRYVLDAKTTRMLAAAGYLTGARSLSVAGDLYGQGTYTHIGGSAGGGQKKSSGGSAGGGTNPGNTTGTRRSDGSVYTTTTTQQNAQQDAVTIAADIANAAVDVASQAAAQTQNISNNLQVQTSANVNAQQQTADTIAAELKELQRLVKKQATKDELYNIWHASQQMSI